MKFELEQTLRGAPDVEVLQDMRRCAEQLGRNTITMAQYEELGKAHPSTVQRRFGSWSKALQLAGLQPSRSKIGISDEEFFENIKSIWILLGRQPKYGEVKSPTSKYSASAYANRFGSWVEALRAFVDWVNSESPDEVKDEQGPISTEKKALARRRTRREVTDRQRFRILVRDGFTCQSCGASPIRQRGVELHVDHIIPWSAGGETLDENLECKCAKCNLGKGNAFRA